LLISVSLITTLLCGCASVGHTFNSGAAENLDFGQVQASNYRSIFGEKPTATEQKSTADGRFEIVRYTYAFADLGSAKARALVLEFKDDKLNAFMYLSSFDESQTHPSLDKLNQISNHVSRKADVVNMLGKPNGKAFCPSNLEDFKESCGTCVEVWKWASMSGVSTFGAAYGGQRPSIKSITVGFDKDGIVSNVSTASANNK